MFTLPLTSDNSIRQILRRMQILDVLLPSRGTSSSIVFFPNMIERALGHIETGMVVSARKQPLPSPDNGNTRLVRGKGSRESADVNRPRHNRLALLDASFFRYFAEIGCMDLPTMQPILREYTI